MAEVRRRTAPAAASTCPREEDGDWQDERDAIDGAAPRLRTTVTIEQPRTIITRNQSPDIGFDRSINPYRGCEQPRNGCAMSNLSEKRTLAPVSSVGVEPLTHPQAPYELNQIDGTYDAQQGPEPPVPCSGDASEDIEVESRPEQSEERKSTDPQLDGVACVRCHSLRSLPER